ncbi:MAG: acetylxylan esterase, partial [Candidatus Competibacter sp.]|nr:acetylxylan esterase [Candidatus Competibacter sp.]
MPQHGFSFDPTHGYDLATLLAVTPPAEPPNFADFWRDLHARARKVTVAPILREIPSTQPRAQVFEVEFSSLDGFRIKGWLTRPRDAP